MIFNFFKSKQEQLFDAIKAKNLSTVKRLISDPKVDINAKNKDGATPLHIAASYRCFVSLLRMDVSRSPRY